MNRKMRITSIIYLGMIIAFAIRSLLIGNYEFLFYAVILSGFWGIIMKTDRRLDYPLSTLVLLILWLGSHLFGGTIYLGETRLYDLILIPLIGEPYHILKYDQLIHFICYLVMTRFVFIPVSKILRADAPVWLIGVMTILAGCGIGAINEVVEFAAVVAFDASESVGGYTNTALDIVCNLFGAIAGWITLHGEAVRLQKTALNR